jgi:hypothetical protein
LRPEDILPSLLMDLERLRLTRADRATVRTLRNEFDRLMDSEDSEDAGVALSDILSDLSDVAERYTPDMCYFGCHSGDGACIGVWANTDIGPDDDVYRSANVPGEDATETRGARRDFAYWLHVNDHGNATLYARSGRRWRLLWSVV